MKKLNNKGFTLIELLAVIVILAVVMGVAATSVLSAMNNSRKSQLQNSAASAADAFRVAYSEMAVTSGNDLLGLGKDPTTALLGGTAQNLTAAVGKKLGITIAADATTANYTTDSFVYFDANNSSFVVCLVANSAGSYYVAAVANSAPASSKYPTTDGKQVSAKKMWACSDNTKSW